MPKEVIIKKNSSSTREGNIQYLSLQILPQIYTQENTSHLSEDVIKKKKRKALRRNFIALLAEFFG